MTCGRFSTGTLVSSINKTDHHDIAEIYLKVALNTITQTPWVNMYSLYLSGVSSAHSVFIFRWFRLSQQTRQFSAPRKTSETTWLVSKPRIQMAMIRSSTKIDTHENTSNNSRLLYHRNTNILVSPSFRNTNLAIVYKKSLKIPKG